MKPPSPQLSLLEHREHRFMVVVIQEPHLRSSPRECERNVQVISSWKTNTLLLKMAIEIGDLPMKHGDFP